jgi:hypothetical protein
MHYKHILLYSDHFVLLYFALHKRGIAQARTISKNRQNLNPSCRHPIILLFSPTLHDFLRVEVTLILGLTTHQQTEDHHSVSSITTKMIMH